MTDHVDVVVIGAGTAGGVVAARLAEDTDRRVLLLEAGPDFPDEERLPPAFVAHGNTYGEGATGVAGPPVPDVDWGYESEALPNGRRATLFRGKLVGGSSMINGCVAVRPNPADFEGWVAAGAAGWSWDDVRPYFEKAERTVPIMRHPRERWLPIQRMLVDAHLELGFRYAHDINAPDAWGEVTGPTPLNRRNEIRQGTLTTYVRAARKRPNFALHDRALVDRVLFDGNRAIGITYIDGAGQRVEVRADHVVLSAGAYGTAPILLRSGIGPAAELAALGIDVLADLPVGRGLLDHPGAPFVFETTRATAQLGWPALAAFFRGEGWFAHPLAFDEEKGLAGVMLCVAALSEPQGSVRIASAAPDAKPIIDHRYADTIPHAFDDVWLHWQRLLKTETFRRVEARDLFGDLPLAERLLQTVGTSGHPVGGCSIGQVVDSDLDVYGIEGLSIADASVFPRHVSNNPNLTCFMLGEAAAARFDARTRDRSAEPTQAV